MSEFHIRRLGMQGDGVADGPVFAPLTLPGEVVSGTQRGNTLTDVRIVTPSDQRISPACRHFKACGGCQLQHASDPLVSGWKTDVVRHAISQHDLHVEFRDTVTSPALSRRRATFAARRTKKGAMAGFHGRASGTIVEIPDCQLLLPEVLAGLPVAEALALVGASRKAPLAVTVTASLDGLDVSVQNGKPLDGPLLHELAQLCDRFGLARLSWNGDVIALRVSPAQQFGTARVTPPPGAFLQATSHGEMALLTAVREVVGSASRVADLFAGCGTFALPLAQNCEVHAVEADADMLAALEKGWRHAPGLKPVTVETRDLFRRPLLPDEFGDLQAVVLDPPRAGADAQVHALATSGVPRIAYVSCNPVTFARDAAQLVRAGYNLDWIQVVDQFRWSTHIELVAAFSR
jgi:23S rRNA (uracil1939-C5)-methyltransferase